MNKKILQSTVKLADANGNLVDIPIDSIYTLLTNESSLEGIAEYDEDTFPIYEIRHNLFNDIADALHGSFNETDCEVYISNLCTQFLEAIKEGTVCNDERNYKKVVLAILKEKADEYDKGTVEHMAFKTAITVIKNEDTW